MYIVKSRIENFDDCRIGDILYEDGDDASYDWKLYTDHNRTVAKLKSKPICPGGLVASIEKKGLNVQTIAVFNDTPTFVATSGYPVVSGTFGGSYSGVPNKPSSPPPLPYRGGVSIGRSAGGGGRAGTIKPPKSVPPKKKTPVTMGKFIEKYTGKVIRKIKRILEL